MAERARQDGLAVAEAGESLLAAQTLADELELSEADENFMLAGQWQLIWWRFKKHRLALATTVVLGFFYFMAVFAEFLAPMNPYTADHLRVFAPPQRIHFDGLQPFVYGITQERNRVTRRLEHVEDRNVRYDLHLFARGFDYKLLGLFRSDLHLFGTDTPDAVFNILGADRLGRDFLSRLIYSFRISLSIGLVGVTISLVLGVLLGGASAYGGPWVDSIIQRVIELLRSIPTLPLWLSLGAAVPPAWGMLQVYFAITVILSFIGWTTVARQVRGKFLVLREEDFVVAARLAGTGPMKVIVRHMVPSFMSHIIAVTTLAIPGMILAETALSFLGLGLRPPAISLGVMLKDAQNVLTLADAPWLLLPGAAVLIIVLAFNFLGDGLRDAADPYSIKR